MFNGTEIETTGGHYIVRNDYYLGSDGKIFRTQLSVRNVTYADSGNYSCRILNLSGKPKKIDNIVLEVKAEGRKLLIDLEGITTHGRPIRVNLSPATFPASLATATLLVQLVIILRGNDWL